MRKKKKKQEEEEKNVSWGLLEIEKGGGIPR